VIRVLVVDDSAVLRHITKLILESDPELKVIGEARNGLEAVAQVERLRPDVITMDLRMPKMDGLEAIRQIMAGRPAPIVVVTGVDLERERHLAQAATQLGAVSIVRRPDPAAPEHKTFVTQLIQRVKLMSAVKVVRRVRNQTTPAPDNGQGRLLAKPAPARSIQVVAIGSSTGGPAALHCILSNLPADFPLPMLVVQHISFGFVEGLASWLNNASPLTVQVARLGQRIQPGQVYVGPDDQHLLVDRFGRIGLSQTNLMDGHRPSATALFQSVAQAYGPEALGVILTGMGADGAAGMQTLNQAGAITIAQDEASCVVFGMPKEAIALGAIQHVAPLDRMAQTIQRLTANVMREA